MNKSYQSDEEVKSYFVVRAGKYKHFRSSSHKTTVKDANVVSEFSNGYRVRFTIEGQTDEFRERCT